MQLKALTTMNDEIVVFWNVAPYVLVESYQLLKENEGDAGSRFFQNFDIQVPCYVTSYPQRS
jgi:hypothetical protein